MDPRLEFILGSIGLKRLLGLEKLTVSSRLLANAENISQEIRKIADKIVEGTTNLTPEFPSTATDLTLDDYTKMVQHVKDELNLNGHIANLIDTVDDIGIEVGAAAANMTQMVQALLPAQSNYSDNTRNLWRLRVVDNPLYTLNLMASSMLASADVNVCKQFYPALYNEMGVALTESVMSHYKPEDVLPRRLKYQMSTFWQAPLMNATTLSTFMQAQEDYKEDTPPTPKSGPVMNVAQKEESK